jgi:hypothetical protein
MGLLYNIFKQTTNTLSLFAVAPIFELFLVRVIVYDPLDIFIVVYAV